MVGCDCGETGCDCGEDAGCGAAARSAEGASGRAAAAGICAVIQAGAAKAKVRLKASAARRFEMWKGATDRAKDRGKARPFLRQRCGVSVDE